jgi:hypothetical protein
VLTFWSSSECVKKTKFHTTAAEKKPFLWSSWHWTIIFVCKIIFLWMNDQVSHLTFHSGNQLALAWSFNNYYQLSDTHMLWKRDQNWLIDRTRLYFISLFPTDKITEFFFLLFSGIWAIWQVRRDRNNAHHCHLRFCANRNKFNSILAIKNKEFL